MKNIKILYKYSRKKLKDFCYITDGEHGSPEWDNSTNLKYITAEAIKPNQLEFSTNFYKTISKQQYIRNTRAIIKKNDLLIYSVGAYAGYSAIAEEHLLPASIPRSVALVRSQNLLLCSPQYLSVFLNSKFGNYQTLQHRAGNAQPMLALEKIREFIIPLLSNNFQTIISTIYNKSYSYRTCGNQLYQEAENLLLEELDLVDFKPIEDNIAIKKFSESFSATGRLDAEYYQPKYDQIINKIKQYKGGYDKLSTFDVIINNSTTPLKEQTYYYIELSEINTHGVIENPAYVIGKELPSRARRTIKTNDILVSSIEGSLNSISIVPLDYNNHLCSTGFFILRISDFDNFSNVQTLFCLLRSIACQMQLKQFCKGTILTSIDTDSFKNILIPIVDFDIQQQIEAKVQESFKLRKQAKQLLEYATKVVELAIEENEEVAIAWLQEKLTELGIDIAQIDAITS